MTPDAAPNSRVTAVATGRPFLPGQSGNPNGRPKKGHAIRDILKAVPVSKKIALVKVAYEEALKGDHQWAEWIVKHSGESGFNLSDGGGSFEMLLVRYVERDE